MPDKDIGKATLSDMSNKVDEWEVTPKNTDSTGEQDETEWINPRWTIQWGYFNEIAELKSAILMKAVWNVGKGYTADAETQVILDHLSGWGKDTFDDIIFNLEVIRRVGGDSFAEIIRDEESGELINLKPLDPGSIKTIVNKQGIIIRYEQVSKLPKKHILKFKPEEILHLSNNRLADQIHGISDIDAVEKNIKANAESFQDIQKVMHRQAKPMIMFKLGTDNQAKIDDFVGKMDSATNKGENIYIPFDKDTVEYEVVQVNVSQLLMTWRDDLRNSFYRTVGLPQIVPGGGGQSTESESKVIYLAFEQIVERDQRYLEKQIWEQLGLKVDFNPPATLQTDLQTDQSKDANQGLEFQPNDFQAGVGR